MDCSDALSLTRAILECLASSHVSCSSLSVMDQHILRTWVSRRGRVRVTVEPIFVKRLPLIKALLRVSLATLSRSALAVSGWKFTLRLPQENINASSVIASPFLRAALPVWKFASLKWTRLRAAHVLSRGNFCAVPVSIKGLFSCPSRPCPRERWGHDNWRNIHLLSLSLLGP